MGEGVARQTIVDAVQSALEPRADVLAMWRGGSDATGRADDLSDVDLNIVVRDDAVADTFTALEVALASLASIELLWSVPTPAWHGHDQRFYRLAGTPEHRMVDVLVMRESAPNRFNEPEQHGISVVLFDRAGISLPQPFDIAAHRERMRADHDKIRVRVPMLAHMVTKSLDRGQPIDAIGFYNRIVLDSLVTLLGMQYRPLRYDFALRYLHSDLPPDVAAELQDLLYVRDGDDLRGKFARAMELLTQLVTSIDVDAIPLEEQAAAARS